MMPLHRHGNATALGVARIGVFGIILREVWKAPLERLANLPSDWFGPWGLMAYLPSGVYEWLLTREALVGLHWLLIGGCVLLILGARPYLPIALATWALFLLFDTLTKGFQGFANHGRAALLIVAFIFAIFPAADGVSVFGRRKSPAHPDLYALPMLASAFLVCLAYAFIGWRRFFASGWAIFVDDTLLNYFVRNSLRDGGLGGPNYGLLVADSYWLVVTCKVGFFVTTLAESLSPLCLLSTRFRRVWLCIIMPFHLGTVVFMKISFLNNLMLIGLLLTAVPYVLAGWISTRGTPSIPDQGQSSPIIPDQG